MKIAEKIEEKVKEMKLTELWRSVNLIESFSIEGNDITDYNLRCLVTYRCRMASKVIQSELRKRLKKERII